MDEGTVDVRDAQPTKLVLAAGGAQALAGLFVALTGLQPILFDVRYRSEVAQYVPYALVLLGAASIALGAVVARAREWAAVSGAALAVLLFVGLLVWTVLNLVWGLYSCIGLFVVPLSLASAVLAVLAVRPCMRATEARKRLADEGLGLGW